MARDGVRGIGALRLRRRYVLHERSGDNVPRQAPAVNAQQGRSLRTIPGVVRVFTVGPLPARAKL
jgi:hypothetical protein